MVGQRVGRVEGVIKMDELYLVYATVGGTGLLLALSSRVLPHLPLSEPLIALALGILVGPQVLGVLDLSDHHRDLMLLEGSRLLLAGSVMAAALRFRTTDLRPLIRTVFLLIAVIMPLAAAVSGAAAVVLGLPVALAALVGACLCPTDPVLAASVVTGSPAQRDLPSRIRRLLTTESGANDGLALPVVAIALATVLPGTEPVDIIDRLAWEVFGALAIGLIMGIAAGYGLRAAVRERSLESGPELVFTLLLAVAVLGTAELARTGSVLAVFVAGLAYNHVVDDHERDVQERIDEAVNRYAGLPLFLILGAVLPWHDWSEFGPAAFAFIAIVLILRRVPLILALGRPLRLGVRDAVFVGWFGPMGISAIFYLSHSMHEGVHDPRLFAAGTLAVSVSVFASALSAAPGRRAYAVTQH